MESKGKILLDPAFWKKESDASILTRNDGFLQREQKKDEYKSLFATAQEWLKAAEVSAEDLKLNQEALDKQRKSHSGKKEDFDRIFVRDAERTFKDLDNQTDLMHILHIMAERIGDYNQGMGLVVGWLMLSLEYNEVLSLLTKLDKNPKYIPGFWRAQSVACATDGYVFQGLLQEFFPDVCAHLKANRILPETFVQKWFNALCVHVLPFEDLVLFFNMFMREGFAASFKFGLSLIGHVEKDILAASQQDKIYEQLRLDPDISNVTAALTRDIVKPQSMNKFDISKSMAQIETLRKDAFETNLKARLEAAAKALEEAEKPASDDVCGFCNEQPGEEWCLDCEKAICYDCRDLEKVDTHDEDVCTCCENTEEDKEWHMKERLEAQMANLKVSSDDA